MESKLYVGNLSYSTTEEQLRDLFFQAGTRLDRTDGWAGKFNSLLSPRAGISYILSESAFWEPFRPVVGTLRLHGEWGRAERDLPEHPIIRSILTVGAVPASPRR